jgi:hypothetical protein
VHCSRLVVAASEQGFLPRTFAKFNERQQTPINGLLLATSLSIVFIIFGDFAHLTMVRDIFPHSYDGGGSDAALLRCWRCSVNIADFSPPSFTVWRR